MTSTRLTNDIRESLTNDILKHRFTADVDSIIEAQCKFAAKVYGDLFDGKTQAVMYGLPEGWLPNATDIGVQFGYVGGTHQFARLYFGGYLTGILGRLQSKPTSTTTTTKRVLSSKAHGCAKVYDPSHPLAIEFGRLKNRTKEVKEAADTAERSIKTTLNAVSTINRLVETWPEVDQFARKYDTGKPSLPALPTDHLNQLLRLA